MSKLAIATKVLLSLVTMLGWIVLPAAAQQSRQPAQSYSQNTAQPLDVATNLNAQRSEFFRAKDLAGISRLLTSDVTYVELLPRLNVFRGQARVQTLIRDVMAANATDLVPHVTRAEMLGNGTILAGGDYTLDVKGRKIPGYFVQILRQEGGTWKIAMQSFARLVAVIPSEASESEEPQAANQDQLWRAASNLNAQRTEYYRKGDLAGLATTYTPDALYIQLAPVFSIMKGRGEVQQHMRELMEARASDISLQVRTAEMTGKDTMIAGGDYSIMAQRGKKVTGQFFQVLRRDGDTWKIAMHTFARPEPITAAEFNVTCDLRCRSGFTGYR